MRGRRRLDGGDVNRRHVDTLEARLRLAILHLHAVEDSLDIRLDYLRRLRRRRRHAVDTSEKRYKASQSIEVSPEETLEEDRLELLIVSL